MLYMVGSRHVTAAANAKINFGNGAVAHAVKARALEGDLRHHARALSGEWWPSSSIKKSLRLGGSSSVRVPSPLEVDGPRL